jgi:hypothetical protein
MRRFSAHLFEHALFFYMDVGISSLCLLIFLWKQKRRRRPIRLRDHPDALAVGCLVRTEQAKPLLQGQLILLPILLGEVSPISGLMPSHKLHRILPCLHERSQRSRRHDDLPQWEFRRPDNG